MPNDIVYILKEDLDTDELRYSLRSIEANFPHRFVWFVGGQPEGFTPDRRIKHKQTGDLKWDMIRSSMWKVLQNEEVSDDFFLFNDDFFVMKPLEGGFINFADGTLSKRVEELRELDPWLAPYGRTLLKAKEELKALGFGEVNYDVHLPMLFNKKLAAEALIKCSSPQMRSVYGNIVSSPYIDRPDVKVYDPETVPEDPDYLSTNDNIFRDGAVGRYIREAFPEPSRFEDG